MAHSRDCRYSPTFPHCNCGETARHERLEYLEARVIELEAEAKAADELSKETTRASLDALSAARAMIQPYRVLVRIQRISVAKANEIGPVAYVPLWWMIDDHDGSMHAVADGAFTIVIATLTATTLPDARKEFAAGYGFYASLLDGVQSRDNTDFAGKLDAFEHAERMTDWWASRAAALNSGKPLPIERHPTQDYKPMIGDRVRMALVVDAVIRARTVARPGGYELQLEGIDEGYGRRSVFVNADEILGIIHLRDNVATRPIGTEALDDQE